MLKSLRRVRYWLRLIAVTSVAENLDKRLSEGRVGGWVAGVLGLLSVALCRPWGLQRLRLHRRTAHVRDRDSPCSRRQASAGRQNNTDEQRRPPARRSFRRNRCRSRRRAPDPKLSPWLESVRSDRVCRSGGRPRGDCDRRDNSSSASRHADRSDRGAAVRVTGTGVQTQSC